MAPLTWRNVDAPDLSAAANMMARATAGWKEAFKGAGDIGRGIYTDKVDIGSRAALQAAQQITDSASWEQALKSGTAYGNMDPRYINTNTLAWGADRRGSLLRDEATIQNMEIQRAQEARAQEAHATRLSGGGVSGGRGRGGGGGGGGGSKKSKKDENWEVTQAEAAYRRAVGEFGEGSDEAIAANNRLAEVSAANQHVSGTLNAADNDAAMFTAQREAREAEAVAADEEATGNIAGFDPAAFSAESSDPAVGNGTGQRSDARGSGNTLTLSSSGSPSEATSPVASIPADPLGYNLGTVDGAAPVDTSVTAPVETAVEASPVASLPGSGSVLTSAGNATSRPPVSSPAAVSPAPVQGVAVDPVALDYGNQIAPAVIPMNRDNTQSLGFGAGIASIGDAAARPAAEAPVQPQITFSDGSVIDAEYAATPEGREAITTFEAEKERVAQENARQEVALAESRDTLVTGAVVDTVQKSTLGVIDELMGKDDNGDFFKKNSAYNGMGKEDEIMADLMGTLNYPESDKARLQQEVRDLAKNHDISFGTAAAAMAGSYDYNPRNWYDWNNLGGLTDKYYDKSKADSFAETMSAKGAGSEARVRAGNLEKLRGEADTNWKKYESAVGNYAKVVTKHGENSKQGREAAKKLLDAQNSIADYERGIRDKAIELGLVSKEDEEAFRNRNSSLEEPRIEDFVNPNTVRDFVTRREVEQQRAIDMAPSGRIGREVIANNLDTVLQGDPANPNRTSFLEWASTDPEAKEAIFKSVQEAGYTGEDITLPPSLEEEYRKFASNNIPEAAIRDFSSVGVDLSGNPEEALAVANDPEVQKIMEIWRNAQNFYTRPSIKEKVQQQSKQTLMDALANIRENDQAEVVIQRNGALGFRREQDDPRYNWNMAARG